MAIKTTQNTRVSPGVYRNAAGKLVNSATSPAAQARPKASTPVSGTTQTPQMSTPTVGAGQQQAAPAADNSGRAANIQRRIDYLKKNRPNDPEIRTLRERLKTVGGGAAAPGGAVQAPPADMDSMRQFIGNMFAGLEQPDFSKAPKILTQDDIEKELLATEEALFREETKFFDRNRLRQIEEAKQEMANRGIPYDPAAVFDPNTSNLYGKTIGAIEEGFKSDMLSAKDRAKSGAAQRVASNVDANRLAVDAFMKQVMDGYNSKLEGIRTSTDVLNSLMQKYGIDKQTAQAELDRQTQERIARIRSAPSGGGGGGAQGGFEIY